MAEEKLIQPSWFEDIIIKLLYTKPEIRDRLVSYINPQIFDVKDNVELVKHFFAYYDVWEKYPTVAETKVDLNQVSPYERLLASLAIDLSEYSEEFILKELEIFIRKKLIFNTCTSAVSDLDEAMDSGHADTLKEAYSFSFDDNVGYDLFAEAKSMYEYLHSESKYVKSYLKPIDHLLGGGFENGTLSFISAPTNKGKSIFINSMAVSQVLHNHNVLYISLEMAPKKLGKRTMANLMNVPIGDLKNVTLDKIESAFAKWSGKLIIKQYTANSISSNTIRTLLKELKLKKKFVPDIIYIDSLYLMKPCGKADKSQKHTMLADITKEVRGIAVDFDVPIVSPNQLNRGAHDNINAGVEDTAGSYDMNQDVDNVFILMQNEDLREAGKFLLKCGKNRDGAVEVSFNVLINYDFMRVSNDPDCEIGNISRRPEPENLRNIRIDEVAEVINVNRKGKEKKFLEFD